MSAWEVVSRPLNDPYTNAPHFPELIPPYVKKGNQILSYTSLPPNPNDPYTFTTIPCMDWFENKEHETEFSWGHSLGKLRMNILKESNIRVAIVRDLASTMGNAVAWDNKADWITKVLSQKLYNSKYKWNTFLAYIDPRNSESNNKILHSIWDGLQRRQGGVQAIDELYNYLNDYEANWYTLWYTPSLDVINEVVDKYADPTGKEPLHMVFLTSGLEPIMDNLTNYYTLMEKIRDQRVRLHIVNVGPFEITHTDPLRMLAETSGGSYYKTGAKERDDEYLWRYSYDLFKIVGGIYRNISNRNVLNDTFKNLENKKEFLLKRFPASSEAFDFNTDVSDTICIDGAAYGVTPNNQVSVVMNFSYHGMNSDPKECQVKYDDNYNHQYFSCCKKKFIPGLQRYHSGNKLIFTEAPEMIDAITDGLEIQTARPMFAMNSIDYPSVYYNEMILDSNLERLIGVKAILGTDTIIGNVDGRQYSFTPEREGFYEIQAEIAWVSTGLTYQYKDQVFAISYSDSNQKVSEILGDSIYVDVVIDKPWVKHCLKLNWPENRILRLWDFDEKSPVVSQYLQGELVSRQSKLQALSAQNYIYLENTPKTDSICVSLDYGDIATMKMAFVESEARDKYRPSSLILNYKDHHAGHPDISVFSFQITNDSDEVLEGLKVHYFFTSDSDAQPFLYDYYTPRSVPTIQKVKDSLWVLQLEIENTILAHSVWPSGLENQVHLRHSNYEPFNKSNDWSWKPNVLFAPNQKIVVTDKNNRILWGIFPENVSITKEGEYVLP